MPFFSKPLPKPEDPARLPPAPRTGAALLQALDRLPYPRRMALVARWASSPQGGAALLPVLEELARGDAYEAGLALIGASHAPLPDLVSRLLQHPSTRIRALAARRLVAVGAEDEVVLEAVATSAPAVRRGLLKALSARPSPVAERILPALLARGSVAEAAIVLPACGAAAVEAHLPVLHHAIRRWRSLARAHPTHVLSFIEGRFAAAPKREHPGLWARYDGAFTELVERNPGEVLRLALAYPCPRRPPSCVAARLGSLLRRLPDPALELLARPEHRATWHDAGLPVSARRSAPLLDDARLLALASLVKDAPSHLGALLDRVAPSRRARILEALVPGDPDDPEALLSALPHVLRIREARRLLARRDAREDPERRLRLAALDAWVDARPVLEAATRSAVAEERAVAWRLLIESCGHNRQGLDETLDLLERLKNEQDPVRLAAFSALAVLPVGLFREAHATALARLAGHPLEARDTSHLTRAALQRLAFRLVRAHAAGPPGSPLLRFALDLLRRLAGQAGSLGYLPPLHDLPRGAEWSLVDTLAPQIGAAEKREAHGLVIDLAQALGRRGWAVGTLQRLLEPVTAAKPESLARRAIELHLACPRTRDERVSALLRRDASAIALAPVFEHLHRKRQDLLDPFLQERAIRGAFLTGKAAYVVPAWDGFERWLPRQQRAFGATLGRIADDPQRSAWERAGAIHRLGRLEVTDAADLQRWMRDPDVSLQEAALATLSRLDRPAPSLPMLLAHLDGDRARVAAYAIARVARWLPSADLVRALREVLDRPRLKVTVHKEIVRLVGAHPVEGAVDLLRSQWARPDLHRDARLAVLHAARQCLDDASTWTLLEEAADSPDRFLASALVGQRSQDLPDSHRHRYARLLLRLASHADTRTRRALFEALPGWAAGLEAPCARAAAAVLGRPDGTPEWRTALACLLRITRDGEANDVLVDVVETLLGRGEPLRPEAPIERDLPATQRLLGLVAGLTSPDPEPGWPRDVRVARAGTLHRLAEALEERPEWGVEALELRVAALDITHPREAAADLADLAGRIEARAWGVPRVLECLRVQTLPHPSGSGTGEPSGDEARGWLEVSEALARHPSSPARRLAVGLLAVVGPVLRWSPPCTDLLARLRDDPDGGARIAARRIFTAPE